MKRCNKCNVMHDGAHVCNWPCPDHDDYWSGCVKCERAAAISEHAPLLAKLSDAAIKHDQNKPDLSLLPRAFLEQTARAFQYGEKKYGRYNFRSGFDYSRPLAAAMRHLVAFNEGENLDPESGLSHLAHASASIGMLITLIEEGKGKDNRYRP